MMRLSLFVLLFCTLLFFWLLDGPSLPRLVPVVFGEGGSAAQSAQTRTVVADLLMIDGNFYVVRGERGEIRIELTPDTALSEKTFKFGDRIKAVILPNDEALSITHAQAGEPVGITFNTPSPEKKDVTPSVAPSVPMTQTPSAAMSPPPQASAPGQTPGPQNRIIVADLLMVDRNFYIVRSERGEIQIEVTPETQLAEKFKFGDRIKAVVTPNDKALSIVRPSADEPNGIRLESTSTEANHQGSPQTSPTDSTKPRDQDRPTFATDQPPASPQQRVIVAEILMVDGDFYVVRGERGEIRIEITPQTKLSEKFGFGDRIKAVVLPNDKALSVERAPR